MFRRFRSAMSILLCACLIFTMSSPLSVLAETAGGAVYKYNDDGTKRTGIKAINYDGVTYYDINKGEQTVKPETGKELEFYKQILLGEAYEDAANPDYEGSSNQLEHWAELAEKIFVKNSKYSTICNAGGGAEKNYGKRWGEKGYTDLSKALSSTTAQSWGKKRNDYTRINGLQYTDSLMKARKQASLNIREMIATNALDKKYSKSNQTSDVLISNAGGDNCMKALNDDTKRDVLYTLVSCVDNEGSTYKYDYSSFVLAFYDFELVPVDPPGVSAITNAEGYESIEEAAKKGAPGVSYKSTDTTTPTSNFYANKSKEPTTASMSFTESKSETAGNSYTSGKSYGFKQTIGWEGEFKSFLGLVSLDNKWSASFETSQVLNTALTESKSTTNTLTTTVTAGITLPPETAAEIDTYAGNVDMTVDYDCPVALRYKVAISSFSGELYADRAATWGIGTAGYTHRTFSTVFGSDDPKLGLGANENLYKRTVTNRNTAGYEETNGNTYGYWMKNGAKDDKSYLNTLDWNDILGDKDIENDPTAPLTIEYREVDSEGKFTGRTINSYMYGNELAPGFEYNIEPANTAVFEYTEPDFEDAESEPVDKTCQASLYLGKVLDEDGVTELDNTFRIPDSCSKSIKIENGDNTLIFYYQCNDPARPDPGKDDDDGEIFKPVSASPGGSTKAAPTNKVLTNEEITSVVRWLGIKSPLSAAGATISYSQSTQNTEIARIKPYYPLAEVAVLNARTVGDYVVEENETGAIVKKYVDGKDIHEGIELDSGEKFYTRGLTLKGLTEDCATFYGFMPGKGKWVRVVKDSHGKFVPDTVSANDAVATFGVDSNLTAYIEAGDIDNIDEDAVTLEKNKDGEYEVYFQYFIDENIYDCVTDNAPATNDKVERAVLKFKVGTRDEDYKVDLKGSFEGKVGEEYNLNDELNASVMDSTGKEIEAPVTWEAKQLKGISVGKEGLATFTKPGTYAVRITGKNRTSDWLTVTAIAAPELDKVEFKVPELRKKQTTITDETTALEYDLPSFLTYADQYGDAWTGDKPEVKFELDEDYAGAEIGENDRLKVTAAGEYKIFAEVEGYDTEPVTIKVIDDRSTAVEKLVVTGTAGAVAGSTVDLNELLRATAYNSKGYEVEVPIKWESKEITGIKVAADGKATLTKPGDYNVRAYSGNTRSDWVNLSVKPARELDTISFKLPSLKKTQTTLTDDRTSLKYELPSYLTYTDQYGDEWKGDKPDIEFELDDGYSGAELDEDNNLVVTRGGEYKVYAQIKGRWAESVTIKVSDERTAALEKLELGGKPGAFTDEPVDLNALFEVTAYNTKGNVIKTPVKWESMESNGIKLTEDGIATFTEPGDYNIRVYSGDIRSDWAVISVEPAKNLKEIRFELPDYKSSEITLTDAKEDVVLDLRSCLSYVDQYGVEWEGALPEVKFTLDSDYDGASIEKGILTITRAGTYKIYAELEGFDIPACTLTVKDNVSAITAKGTLTGVVGHDKRYLDDTMTVHVYDKNSKEIDMSHSWEVQELSGLTIIGQDLLHFTAPGTYHVRAVARTGEVSDWLTIKAVELEINKTYIKKLSRGKAKFKATWAKSATKPAAKKANGYLIMYSKDPDFSNYKSSTVTSYKTTSRTFKKLSRKTPYYVRVRAYKTIDGFKYYTDWSTVRSVVTK